MAVPDLSMKDYLEIRGATFEWAQSYDTKDWERCKRILAPAINLDFRPFHGEFHQGITPEKVVGIVGDQKIIGDARLKTQHLLGASQWSSAEDGQVLVAWQARVAHQRYKAEDMKEVANKGHGYGVLRLHYKKIGGKWKVSGITPGVDWFEYDLFGTLNPPQE